MVDSYGRQREPRGTALRAARTVVPHGVPHQHQFTRRGMRARHHRAAVSGSLPYPGEPPGLHAVQPRRSRRPLPRHGHPPPPRVEAEPLDLPTVDPPLTEELAEAERALHLTVRGRESVTGSELGGRIEPSGLRYAVADACEMTWLPYHGRQHMAHSFPLISPESTDGARSVADAYDDTPGARRSSTSTIPIRVRSADSRTPTWTAPRTASPPSDRLRARTGGTPGPPPLQRGRVPVDAARLSEGTHRSGERRLPLRGRGTGLPLPRCRSRRPRLRRGVRRSGRGGRAAAERRPAPGPGSGPGPPPQQAGYKIPRQLVLATEIQRSPRGKADYRWARALAAGDGSPRRSRPRPPGPAAGRDPRPVS